jgi:hypothetical protein
MFFVHVSNSTTGRQLAIDSWFGVSRATSIRYRSVELQATSFASLPQKLDVVLSLVVSAISVAMALLLLVYGGKDWRDFKMGVYIVLSVLGWSVLQLVSGAFAFSVHRSVVHFDGDSSVTYLE